METNKVDNQRLANDAKEADSERLVTYKVGIKSKIIPYDKYKNTKHDEFFSGSKSCVWEIIPPTVEQLKRVVIIENVVETSFHVTSCKGKVSCMTFSGCYNKGEWTVMAMLGPICLAEGQHRDITTAAAKAAHEAIGNGMVPPHFATSNPEVMNNWYATYLKTGSCEVWMTSKLER